MNIHMYRHTYGLYNHSIVMHNYILLMSFLLYASLKLTGICSATQRVGSADLVTSASEILLTISNCNER